MSFENFQSGKGNAAHKARKHRGEAIELNSHINFTREKRKGNARKDITKVKCIRCEDVFELPFKPRRPEVYCDACFKRKKREER